MKTKTSVESWTESTTAAAANRCPDSESCLDTKNDGTTGSLENFATPAQGACVLQTPAGHAQFPRMIELAAH